MAHHSWRMAALVLRVITGLAKGKRLSCPDGRETRPPTDFLKGALFNILAGRVADARVLDLFAGSGAFGIEALSRGAVFCVFVDRSREAQKFLRANLDHVRFLDRSEVLTADVSRSLSHLSAKRDRFSLIFMDPPFAMSSDAGGRGFLREAFQGARSLLAPGGTLVLRLPRRREAAEGLPDPADLRTYGESEVRFYA